MILKKLKQLENILKNMKTVAVAYSAGVDSTFLLKVAHSILGNNAIAITAVSSVFPKRETDNAIEFCKKENIKHFLFEFNPLEIKGYKENPQNRCYICKLELFKKIKHLAGEKTVIEGSNTDDLNDFRPGLRAIKELDIKSPMQQAGLLKKEIRELSKQLGLNTYNKSSFACLASRFPYGDEITKEKLQMLDKAEFLLYGKGFKQFRVRIHRHDARIEILPDDFEKLLSYRQEITEKFQEYGFDYVSMDLCGYKTGNMNKHLK